MTPCGRRARLLPAKATGLVLMLWASSCAGAGVDEAALQRVEVDGSERTYRLYVPADAPERGLPLMIVLHGGLGNAESMEQSTGMDRVADTGHFLVAYPNGTEGAGRMKNRRTWNAGTCCGIARRKRVDDVAFIARMIDQIAIRHSIDPDRVVAVGLSNGAMMAYRLACELPDRFAAVVAVAGTLAMSGCPGDGKAGGDGANAVGGYHIHGDSDQDVHFEGGRGS